MDVSPSNARETLETVSWVELDGEDVVVLQNIPSAHIVAINLPVGSRFPALTSPSGQVLLSSAPERQLLEMLDALAPEVRARFGMRNRADVLAIFRKTAEPSGWRRRPLSEALSAGHRAQAGRAQLWLRRRQSSGATEWQKGVPRPRPTARGSRTRSPGLRR
ncbi:IclR family transcriptional regulator domain-containing protein [Variovorax sp. RT4R15]|uniref:IclR family transcriptional regulator domain-containing protein n=1 Tax=Variovorax sp. RT4R15 TaxID=3443737 RepID=UPI003F4875C3